MKYDKLQKDIISMMYKEQTNRIKWNVNEDKKEVHITLDGYALHSVPFCFWYLDTKKFTSAPLDTNKIIPSDTSEYSRAEYTGITKEVTNGKNKMHVTTLQADGIETNINIDLLKKYHDINELYFLIIDSIHPALMYSKYSNTFEGVVMPVRI